MNATRRWFLGTAASAAVLHAGCNLGTLAYFLTPEQRNNAKMAHLAHKEEKKVPKVVILTHTSLDIDAEMIHADREVADKLATQMKLCAAASKEKVDIVQPRKVEDYKNSHPSWRSREIPDVGRHFKADHVIYLEFLSLSMRDPKAVNMFKGKAAITIQLFDVNNPDEPPQVQTFSYTYPNDARGGIPIDADAHPDQFRQDFLTNVAKRLLPYFMNHPRQDHYSIE